MKRLLMGIVVIGLLAPIEASAAPGHDRGHDQWAGPDGRRASASKPLRLPPVHLRKLWRQGEQIPASYITPEYFIAEPGAILLPPPAPGHRWINIDGDGYLIDVASGTVEDLVVVGPTDDVSRSPQPVVTAQRDDR